MNVGDEANVGTEANTGENVYEVNEVEMPPDECEIGALEESPISFTLSGLNERLRRHDQSDEESTSSGDSAMQSPRSKPGDG